MRAVVLNRACKPEDLKISEITIPEVKPGWVLVKVKAFGLNHAELVLRKYEVDAPYINAPIIPGIECVGVIADPSDSDYRKGDRVVALMGGMGRSFHGSYAEYALLPVRHVFQANTDLDFITMAAVPETFYTAYSSLYECLQLEEKDVLFVHGATSALGLAAIQLAKAMGCTVIGTTRNRDRLEFLKDVGADYALLDDTNLLEQILELFPKGVTKVLELVGVAALPTSSRLVKKHGIICVTGQLGGSPGAGFDVIKNIPNGVYLSSFYSNYPTQEVIDTIFRRMDQFHIDPVIGKLFTLEEIASAHKVMENNMAQGKIVIRVE